MRFINLGFCLLMLYLMTYFWQNALRKEPSFDQLSFTQGVMSRVNGCKILSKRSEHQFYVTVNSQPKAFMLDFCSANLANAQGKIVEIRTDHYKTVFGQVNHVLDIRTKDQIYLDYNNPRKHSTLVEIMKFVLLLILGCGTFLTLRSIFRIVTGRSEKA